MFKIGSMSIFCHVLSFAHGLIPPEITVSTCILALILNVGFAETKKGTHIINKLIRRDDCMGFVLSLQIAEDYAMRAHDGTAVHAHNLQLVILVARILARVLSYCL